MNRFVCIHGHFYQPPRENPWLEEIEIQDSAAPYHDWNERISAECYGPNSASRILDKRGRITAIVNNYARLSFDFGPTLLSWLEKRDPEVYRAVLAADRAGRARFSGHGPALAQPFNHMILPLANARDKRTQVLWGRRDFEHRFGRPPEGLWLPETAVDTDTLEVLAEAGIAFTIVAPHQALRTRPIGAGTWRDADGGLDGRRPYLCRLPSGRSIHLFFYDGAIAHDVAFGDLLRDGEGFAGRLNGGFRASDPGPQLVHIATDGETYGHHHRFGDMALAYALGRFEENGAAGITVYGEFLERFPPAAEVELRAPTSWSCAHGVERWRADCGCRMGGGGDQRWRAPLRTALDWLRDALAALYEDKTAGLIGDPWAARDDYIAVVLDRSEASVRRFLDAHRSRPLGPGDAVRALGLLEMQRNAMLMFTSCGWFFDDLSGLEAVQNLHYAARAVQLAREAGGPDLEPELVRRLEQAPARGPFENGARLYDSQVKPAVVDLARVAVHYAVSSLFNGEAEAMRIGAFTAEAEGRDLLAAGPRRLSLGRVRVRSEILRREDLFAFAAVHLGGSRIAAGVRPYAGDEPFARLERGLRTAFGAGDVGRLLDRIERSLGGPLSSLPQLFRDARYRIVRRLLETTLADAESAFRRILAANDPVLEMLHETKMPLPKALAAALEFTLNRDLREILERDDPDIEALGRVVDEFRRWSLQPESPLQGFLAVLRIEGLMDRAVRTPGDPVPLESARDLLAVWRDLPLDMNLWRPQNKFFALVREQFDRRRRNARGGDAAAARWLEAARALGEALSVVLPDEG